MSDPKFQKNILQSAQQTGECKGESKIKKDFSLFLSAFGGFTAVKSFIPEAEYMNPALKAACSIFLTDSRFKEKRMSLARELEGWIELLNSGKNTPSEFVEECRRKEAGYQQLLNNGITAALEETRDLETAYRVLDSFFNNAGTDKATNLRLINVRKKDIADPHSEFAGEVSQLLKNAFDRLSLKDSYSLMVIPGYVFQDKPTLLRWAEIAFKYKVLLITDHADETTPEDLRKKTQEYHDSDQALQNVVMTVNWIVGRESEKLSEVEKEDSALFIPPSGALAGKLYDESINMAQGAGGKRYGTLYGVPGVRNDLFKAEIVELMENQVIPMVFSDGRVLAFNNNTLYSGDNDAMKEYPIVRVFDWIKKVLMNYVHEVALENWDYNSPENLKNKIQDFLNQYQGYGNLFQRYDIKEPQQDPVSKRITVSISLTPFYAAKNFIIKLAADKKTKECETE